MRYKVGILLFESDTYHELIHSEEYKLIENNAMILVADGHEKAVSCIREIREWGANILLCRISNTVSQKSGLFDNINMPVMRIPFTIYDVMTAVYHVKGHYKHIYVFLRKDNFPFPAHSFKDIFDDSVSFIFVDNSNSDYEEKILSIPRDPDTVAVCSSLGRKICEQQKINYELIRLSAPSVWETYRYGIQYLKNARQHALDLSKMVGIMSNIDDGILMLSEDLTVIEYNSSAEKILGIPREAAVNSNLKTLLPELYSIYTHISGKPGKDALLSVNGHNAMVTLTEVTTSFDQEKILILKDITLLQRAEQNARFRLSKTGFVASVHFEDIQTCEPSMINIINRAKRFACSDSSIIISGESGTGKEYFAQSIHNYSPRKMGPFVAVNCAALSESLLESELFGYVEGAFTGARKNGKAGFFEMAHRGTIFIDEINSIPMNIQVKLLRVLEQRNVVRLGSDYVIPLDIRIICATNEDLWTCVQEGRFREDLFYRLNVLPIHIPPLRQRPGDIELQFTSFLSQFMQENHPCKQPDKSYIDKLLDYSWPGNTRELKNFAEKYVLDGGTTPPPEKPVQKLNKIVVDDSMHLNLKEITAVVEDLVIHSLLDKGLTKSETARILGISRTSLFNKLNK